MMGLLLMKFPTHYAVFETGLKIKGDMLQNGWGVDLRQDSTTDTIGLNFITITILQLYSGW